MSDWIFSILLYLITVACGYFIDKATCKYKLKPIRKFYIAWLFIFLCFGYMCGADWPFYERDYYEFDLYQLRYLREPGSWLLFKTMPSVIHDFWIFIAIFKCLYLGSVILLLSRVTDRWLSAAALSIPIVLAQLLIQNPFRFMLAQIFINYAVLILYNCFSEGKIGKMSIIKVVALIIIAILFHNASIVYILLFPFLFFIPRIGKAPSWFLFTVYLVVAFIASNVSFVTNLISGVLEQLSPMEMKNYSDSYNPEDNAQFFTLGSMAEIVFFIIVLLVRRPVISKTPNGGLIYALTICYFTLSRLVMIIPTGHRFTWPLSFFYAIYIIEMLRNIKIKQYGLLLVFYIMLAFTKKLWVSYDLIPYTNSIPYILTGHKPYTERYKFNPEQNYERNGVWPEIMEREL